MPLVEGKKRSHRPGLRYCNACKSTFTVTVGTVFERSKIPLTKWWLAMHLMGASKKGISAHQLYRMLGFGSYRTAWFMAHRIREAMKDLTPGPDWRRRQDRRSRRNLFRRRENPQAVTSRARAVPTLKRKRLGTSAPSSPLSSAAARSACSMSRTPPRPSVRDVLVRNVRRESRAPHRRKPPLHRDWQRVCRPPHREALGRRIRPYEATPSFTPTRSRTCFPCSSAACRRLSALRRSPFAPLPRGFDFRYNRRTALGWTDAERVTDIARGIEGKRLTYRRIGEAQNATPEG